MTEMDYFSHIKPRLCFSILTIVALLILNGCGSKELPIEKLKRSLQDAPDYSIILDDMKGEGTFSRKYYHRYNIIQGDLESDTSWLEVPKNFYENNSAFLGMTLVSKKDGKISSTPAPPGYNHVGDSRYGRWRNDHRGHSFWEFYGQYAFFSTMFGGYNRPIYRSDYNDFRGYRSRNAPYYGRNKEFGTNGSFTKKAKPNFFARRKSRESMKKSSFNKRVSKRVGRTRTSYRGRSGGFGK